MDAYRYKNQVVLWIKTHYKDFTIKKNFSTFIYIEICPESKNFLRKYKIKHFIEKKKTYLRKTKNVYAIKINNISEIENIIRFIEEKTRYRVPLYNTDIAPEQLFLYKNKLIPLSSIAIESNAIYPVILEAEIPLKKITINVIPKNDIRKTKDTEIKKIILNDIIFEGQEELLLNNFTKEFIKQNPDIILMDYAFSRLPYLQSRLDLYNIPCPFHRFDPIPIKYKGGKSFFSYGQVYYRDFAIRLHGRFLVDTSTFVGDKCQIESIMELCQLSGNCFQQVCSRSFGAVFQSALVKKMVELDLLIPYKEKPLDKPLTILELLKADRAGHTLDPKIGFHKDVAEIDFCSMFPWLIYNYNISADTILNSEGPFQEVPNVPIKVSLKNKGLVPLTIKPFLDRRMEYKNNYTSLNRAKAIGLKWVLVTSYGYLRFREFKLGLASSHMAICSYARETILNAVKLAEEKGFEVVHGIVDSLFIKKKNITEEEVKEFCKDLGYITGIPVSFEGIFKFIVFLPSINDKYRALPARYYGVFRNKEIKARGIEIRQKSTPLIVQYFQYKCIEIISDCDTKKNITEKIPVLCKFLRDLIKNMRKLNKELFISKIVISKLDYKNNIPQKIIINELTKKNIIVMPGQVIKFIHVKKNKVVLSEDYKGNLDICYYKKLLIRSLYIILQPFDITKYEIENLSEYERQSMLNEYTKQYNLNDQIKKLPRYQLDINLSPNFDKPISQESFPTLTISKF